MEIPKITNEQIIPLLETRFIKVYDLQYKEGKHYFDATRRSAENLAAVKSEEEFKEMLPDAVTCIVILKAEGQEPKLLMSYEFRYPAGRFLLSPPAGLIDPEDQEKENPLFETAKREIFEETGLQVEETDLLKTVSPLAFSTPGMTDESNALVAAVISVPDYSELTQNNSVGSELFNGFELISLDDASEILERGTDKFGHFYSVYTWAALMYFVSGRWNK